MKRGIFLAPFEEAADPRVVMDLAQGAEAASWDGFFLWDHIRYDDPAAGVADAWVAMSAIATATQTLRIGPLVTPLARRRVQKLARETVSLDHLSRGRLTLGVGLGTDHGGELSGWGEELDPRRRAELLDERLERLAELWAGEFQPPPMQRPRIPVWVAGRYPHRRPLARAARWDGFFPIELPNPDALTELATELGALRGDRDGDYDLVAETGPGEDPSPWATAGATWVLVTFGEHPRLDAVRATIEAGPG